MSEKTEGTQGTEQKTEGKQEPTYTPIQLKAIDQGWIPKEEFDGEADEFIDAPEFVRRGELFSKISTQNKKVQQLEQALDAMRIHNSQIKKVEYDRALKALKNAKTQAIRDGEHEQAADLDEKIEEVKEEAKKIDQDTAAKPNGYSPEFLEWVEKETWYETNETMRDAADGMARRMVAQGKAPAEIFKTVSAKIREEFPEKFRSSKLAKTSPVEGSSRRTSQAKSDDVQLEDWELDMMKKIVKTGVMTEAEYKAQRKSMR